MKTFGIASMVAAMLMLWGSPATAHHSAVQFDFTKTVAITGVVKRFEAINPHMRLVLHVKDAKGERDIEFEGHSTNNMYRAGYRDKMIKFGDTITVQVAPLKTGAEGGYVTAAVTASGQRFGAQSREQRATERERAESR
ncbi:MAG: DUF6152 family protein [Acidobacteriota bacterium]